MDNSYSILPKEQTLNILAWNLKQIQQASKFFVFFFFSKKSYIIGYFFIINKRKDQIDSPNSQKSLTFQTKKVNHWISFLWSILTFISFLFFYKLIKIQQILPPDVPICKLRESRSAKKSNISSIVLSIININAWNRWNSANAMESKNLFIAKKTEYIGSVGTLRQLITSY